MAVNNLVDARVVEVTNVDFFRVGYSLANVLVEVRAEVVLLAVKVLVELVEVVLLVVEVLVDVVLLVVKVLVEVLVEVVLLVVEVLVDDFWLVVLVLLMVDWLVNVVVGPVAALLVLEVLMVLGVGLVGGRTCWRWLTVCRASCSRARNARPRWDGYTCTS